MDKEDMDSGAGAPPFDPEKQPVSRHTPGPWYLEQYQDGFHVLSRDSYVISTHDTKEGGEEEAANARLIAAAPDLLEALKALQDAAALTASGEILTPEQAKRVVVAGALGARALSKAEAR